MFPKKKLLALFEYKYTRTYRNDKIGVFLKLHHRSYCSNDAKATIFFLYSDAINIGELPFPKHGDSI
jgi:hypothetical protein